MLAALRRHPIPMEATLEHCLVLTFAGDARVLETLLPPGLRVETYKGHGMAALGLVQARRMRPAGAPPWLGCDFFLAGLRVFARSCLPGERRGLRIVASLTDRWPMRALGNWFTRYNYRGCESRVWLCDGRLDVSVHTERGDFHVVADIHEAAIAPIPGSPFVSLDDARRFEGPLPLTFDYEPATRSIVVIRGERERWQPTPVNVRVLDRSWLDRSLMGPANPVLAGAFYVSGVPYRWSRGVRRPLPEVLP